MKARVNRGTLGCRVTPRSCCRRHPEKATIRENINLVLENSIVRSIVSFFNPDNNEKTVVKLVEYRPTRGLPRLGRGGWGFHQNFKAIRLLVIAATVPVSLSTDRAPL